MSAVCEYSIWHSEKPQRQIKIVNLREHNATTQIAARGVALSIIFVWMPAWKTFAKSQTRRHQGSNRVFLQQFLNEFARRMKAQRIRNECSQILLRHDLRELFDVFS